MLAENKEEDEEEEANVSKRLVRPRHVKAHNWWELPESQYLASSEDLNNLREELNRHAKYLYYNVSHVQERLRWIQDFVQYPNRLKVVNNETNLIAGEIWLSAYILTQHCKIKEGGDVKIPVAYQQLVDLVIVICQHMKTIKKLDMRKKVHPLIETVVNDFFVNPNDQEMMSHISSFKIMEGLNFGGLMVSPKNSATSVQTNGSDTQIQEAEPNSVANQESREILHRTADNKAWRSFRKTVEMERKDMIDDMLAVSVDRCARLLYQMEKLQPMLFGTKCFFFKTLWIEKSLKSWKFHLAKLLANPKVPKEDRMRMYTVALEMKYSFEKISQLLESFLVYLMELGDVTYNASLYLAKDYRFHIKRYKKLKKISHEYDLAFQRRNSPQLPTNNSQVKMADETGSPRKLSPESSAYGKEEAGDKTLPKHGDAFFSKEYPGIHRKNAITIGDMEVILQSHIKKSHSMMLDEGPRYLELGFKNHIWLAGTRKSGRKRVPEEARAS